MNGLAKVAGFSMSVPTSPKEIQKRDAFRKGQNAKNKQVYDYLKQNYPEDCIHWAKLVDWNEADRVPLKNIKMARRPGGPREQDKVKNIAQAIQEGKKMDRVILVQLSDGSYKIADGYHRTLGFQKANKGTIAAWVARVPEDKGPWDKEMHEKKLNVGKPALKKEASLLGLAGLAAGVHIAPNLIMKGIKSTKKGHDALTGTFSAGVEMGRNSQKLHPNAQSFIEYGLGPETLVDYRLGHKLGTKLRDIDPEKQDRFLQKVRGIGEAQLKRNGVPVEDLEKVPVMNTLINYMDGRGENKIKKGMMRMGVPEDQPHNWKHKPGNLAMLGGAAAIDPHLLMQPAISGARKAVAKSEIGRNFMDNQFHKGMDGKKMSKAKEVAMDTIISPAAADPFRIGKFVNDKAPPSVKESLQDVSIGQFLAPPAK